MGRGGGWRASRAVVALEGGGGGYMQRYTSRNIIKADVGWPEVCSKAKK